jgi:hypothetical protein
LKRSSGFYFYNTRDEVDRATDAVASVVSAGA